MKIRALNTLALMAFGIGGVAHAATAPTGPANLANVTGPSATNTLIGAPPLGVVVGQRPAAISQAFGSVVLWRGCFVADWVAGTDDSSKAASAASN